MSAAGSGRATRPPGLRPFPKGVSGNPSGRSKEIAAVEALARSKSAQAIDELMRIAKGRGIAAVRAAELVLAYGLGRPQHQLAITAKGGSGPGGATAFAGAARMLLEAAIERAEGSATVLQTVADSRGATENTNGAAVIDVTAEPLPAEPGQSVGESTGEGVAQ